MANDDIPLVYLAAFCERVLQEQDGTISLIRIIDRVTATLPDGVLPENIDSLKVSVNAMLGFKSGPVTGTREVGLRIRNPRGEIQETKSPVPMNFLGGHHGINLIFALGFEARLPGVHWIDVILDDHVVTAMPLEVVHQVGPLALAPAPTDQTL